MVAIKGINMPNECYNCPLLDDEYGTCNIIGETKVDMTVERSKNCPLVEIEERKAGKWIKVIKPSGLVGFECLNCGAFYPFVDKLNYCPTCGAEMRGNEND